jgi:hypothetical protein
LGDLFVKIRHLIINSLSTHKSNEVFYPLPILRSTDWKSVEMPNIIQNRVDERGVSEVVSGAEHQESDYIIAARTGLFNQSKNNGTLVLYTEGGGLIPSSACSQISDLDVNRVKAIAMQESNCGIRSDDIMTANFPGDWENTRTIKEKYGLKQNELLDINRSLYYGIRILASKGFKFGVTYDREKTGDKTFTFQGWDHATKHFNGNGVPNYNGKVQTMMDESVEPNSWDYR